MQCKSCGWYGFTYVDGVGKRQAWPPLFGAVGAIQILLLPVQECGIQVVHFDPGYLEPPSVISFHTAPATLSATHTQKRSRRMWRVLYLSLCEAIGSLGQRRYLFSKLLVHPNEILFLLHPFGVLHHKPEQTHIPLQITLQALIQHPFIITVCN